jgi:hypothetical protein
MAEDRKIDPQKSKEAGEALKNAGMEQLQKIKEFFTGRQQVDQKRAQAAENLKKNRGY